MRRNSEGGCQLRHRLSPAAIWASRRCVASTEAGSKQAATRHVCAAHFLPFLALEQDPEPGNSSCASPGRGPGAGFCFAGRKPLDFFTFQKLFSFCDSRQGEGKGKEGKSS